MLVKKTATKKAVKKVAKVETKPVKKTNKPQAMAIPAKRPVATPGRRVQEASAPKRGASFAPAKIKKGLPPWTAKMKKEGFYVLFYDFDKNDEGEPGKFSIYPIHEDNYVNMEVRYFDGENKIYAPSAELHVAWPDGEDLDIQTKQTPDKKLNIQYKK